MIYGYARVSTNGQARDGNSLEYQEKILKQSGAEEMYIDHYTGTKSDRPEFSKLLNVIRSGDTIVTTKIDRLFRNLKQGIDIVDDLLIKGVTINILNLGIMNNTPMGRLTRNVMMAFAEYERDMIVERTQEGKAIAKLNPNFKEGRPKKEVPEFMKYYGLVKSSSMTINEAIKKLSISRSMWYMLEKQNIQQGIF